jgi:nitrate/nitrite transporter NarK
MVWGYWPLVIVRFAFGAAEAGAFPSIARALARWFYASDLGRVSGIMWMSARLGGAIAPPLATLFIGWFGWRLTFSIFGLVGVTWCLAFWRLYRDDPAKHPAATAADLAYISKDPNPPSTHRVVRTPWKRLFLSGNLWAIFWMYFGTSYGFWFLLTWLPTYLIRQHKLSPERSGFYAALPLAVGAVACLVGGVLSDWLVRVLGSLLWGRRLVGLGGYLLAAAGFAAAGMVQKPLAAVLCLALAEAGLDLAVPVAWAACLEVGGRFGGTATGFMNAGSSISAFISPLAAAWLYTKFGTFDAMFMSAAAVYLFSGLLWLLIDATQIVASD